MKTIFNEKTLNELIDRIKLIDATDKAQWGKMDAFQMVRHCNISEEMYLGKTSYKRLFIGKIFGKMALNATLKDENPMSKNSPTHPDFKITGSGNIESEKSKWIGLLNQYLNFSNPNFVHPFFGSMTKEQIGNYVYKHTDHHLRQFNR